MWKHLEKHRHRYGLVLFGLNLAWLAIGFLPGNGAGLDDHLRRLAVFAAVTAIVALYYGAGVPGLLQGLTIAALAAVCLAGALIPVMMSLPAMTLDFAYASAAILFVVLVFFLRLPRKARLWAVRLVRPDNPAARRHECQIEAAEAQSVVPDRTVANAAQPCQPPVNGSRETAPRADRPETQLPEQAVPCRPSATPYRQVSQYKQALLDSFRSWSLINALPAMRWLRAAVALALLIGGTACIVYSVTMERSSANYFRSNRFALLLAGVAALCYAIGVVLLGFLRGLAAPGFFILTFYSVLGAIRIEAALANRPLVIRIAVILLFLALYGLLVSLLVKNFRQRHDLFNWVYQLESRLIGVDIALKDLLPIAEYTGRIDATVTLAEAPDDERLRQEAIDVATWYQHRLNVRKILPVGFTFDAGPRRLALYAYCRTGQAADAAAFCERILAIQGLTASVRHADDPEWTVYLEKLFPDPVILHEIINLQQLDLLESEGIDLHAVHPIRIELRFPDCLKRTEAQARLAAAGYAAVADEAFDNRERAVDEETPDFCIAFIELNTRLGIERINTITGMIICLIEPYDGDLFGWELIAPTDAERFGDA